MYTAAAELLKEHKDNVAQKVTEWVKTNYPERTQEYDKCTRDVGFILNAIVNALMNKNTNPIDSMVSSFFKIGKLQLKSIGVEFDAYNYMLSLIKDLFDEADADMTEEKEYCDMLVMRFKNRMSKNAVFDKDNIPEQDPATRAFNVIYGWDDERRIMRHMQQAQRNYDYSMEVNPVFVDYLLWVAQNTPSKQHEAYYDVYYSTDRETIDYLYKYTWGTTHTQDPPACWRNSQMRGNLYMMWVLKVPPTMYNCNPDGTFQHKHGNLSRWENAIMAQGMSMSLVMRAANKMGLRTGPHKVNDLGPDYDGEWGKLFGIQDDIDAGNKRIMYGLGIGFPNEGRPRWEVDDDELCIGASQAYHITTKTDEPTYDHKGNVRRMCRIVNIKDRAGEIEIDPYGNEHVLPDKARLSIQTPKKREINLIEIPKPKK